MNPLFEEYLRVVSENDIGLISASRNQSGIRTVSFFDKNGGLISEYDIPVPLPDAIKVWEDFGRLHARILKTRVNDIEP